MCSVQRRSCILSHSSSLILSRPAHQKTETHAMDATTLFLLTLLVLMIICIYDIEIGLP